MVEGYEALEKMFKRAFERATQGKGAERHANGKPFEKQPIMALQDILGPGGPEFQICKKVTELKALPPDAAIRELQDIMVYAAAKAIKIEKDNDTT